MTGNNLDTNMKYEGFKNYSTWNLALSIDNDKAVQDKILKGLAVCARRYMGFSPRASSHPFITSFVKPKDLMADDVAVESQGRKENALKVGNQQGPEQIFAIRVNSGSLGTAPGLVDDENYRPGEVDTKEILNHLLSKHWADVVEKARKPKEPDDTLSL